MNLCHFERLAFVKTLKFKIASTNLHVLQLQLELPPLFLSLLLPRTHQLGEAVLLLWQALLSLILPVNLTSADRAAPRTRRAQEGRRAVAPPVVVAADVVAVAVSSVVIAAVAAVLVLTVALLVVVAGVGSDQRRVTHAADDVLHAGALGAKVLVGQPVQVEGGEGEGLRGCMGVMARRRRRPPEGAGGRRRGKRRPGREAVGGAVPITRRVAAGVLGLDL